MTVKECYLRMNADYDAAIYRMQSDKTIARFLNMLLRDENFSLLSEAIKNQDYDAAFQAAHTLKGVTLNLSLTELAFACEKLTENLREQNENAAILPLYENLKIVYDHTVVTIEQLLEEVSDSEKTYYFNCG